MKNISAELFIARRTARPSDGRRTGLMERIAVISVALSLAVMIVALAVIAGFKREIAQRLSGLGAHIAVTAPYGDPSAPPAILRNESAERALAAAKNIASVRAFDSKGGVVRSERAMQGVILKGIDGGYEDTSFGRWMVGGELPRTGGAERTKDILISLTTARQLAVGVGDKVEMIFIDGDADGGDGTGGGGGARRDRFRISGIYSTGMEEMEALALTDIRNVQRLSDRAADEAAGYEIMLDDFSHVDESARRVAEILADSTDEYLRVRTVAEMYPNIFDWLRTHDVNAAVIIGVMLAVALFNMIAALLITVLERTRMIGILKSFGMTDGALQRLFLYRSAAITLRGLLWGNLAGLGLCAVQWLWHPVKLDAAGYLLSEVPVHVVWWHLAVLNAGAAAVIVAAMALPARLTSRIRPEQAIKYE